MLFLYVLLALAAGAGVGYYLRQTMMAKQTKDAEGKALELLNKTKSEAQDILLNSKKEAQRAIDEARKEEQRRRQELTATQKRLEQREEMFDKKLSEIETKQQAVMEKSQQLDAVKQEVLKIKEEQYAKLERIAGLDKAQAKDLLMGAAEKEYGPDILERLRKIQDETSEEMEMKAKKVLANVIQRVANSHVAEVTTTIVDLPSEDMKGRIIGKEGRNIKLIERLTGVELIVDDTPEMITISSFSPIRRHLAKRALDKMLADGRIQPARIEEVVELAKKEMAIDIKKAGEEAAYKAGVAGIDPKVLNILGRLKYRTSYGQNVLLHSIEVAHLSALLGEELGADVAVCRKGGLLHDLGKAVDHEVQGTHPEIGGILAKKFGLPQEIIYPIANHHDDIPPTLEALIVKVADAISGGRPGARRDTHELYVQRLTELEGIATRREGVDKAYAIQAGRELRIFVSAEKLDDMSSFKLSRDIANDIQTELKYPGEIKVNVIREKRFVEFAR
ncbi:MAG: ribonuclease Y [Parcubacteria group bacterium]|nr:ribonuclease Y [Parcubacteria group bacterium]